LIKKIKKYLLGGARDDLTGCFTCQGQMSGGAGSVLTRSSPQARDDRQMPAVVVADCSFLFIFHY
jgi:hypothetical protein